MIRCGVDVIECKRIADGIERLGDRFLQRFFTEGEREDCGDKPYRLAARFAAKEAVGKALGTGIGDIRWVDIEVRVDDERRRPRLIPLRKSKVAGRQGGTGRMGRQPFAHGRNSHRNCGRQIG